MNRTLIILGVGCIAVGVLWPWLRTLPLGRLPSGILIVRDNFCFFFPFTSGIIVSMALSILLWFLQK